MRPLQPAVLHPSRSAADFAGDEAETDAHAHPPGRRERIAELRNQSLLLGRSKRDVNDIRAACGELLAQIPQLRFIGFEPDGRARDAGDSQSGKTLGKFSARELRGTGRSAQQEDRSTRRAGGLRERED
jgi:hypothetical protein